MKNKTLAYEKILTVSSRILRKKATYKKTFFSMMARVWEKGTYRKKFVMPVIHPLFFFLLFLQCPRKIYFLNLILFSILFSKGLTIF